VSLRKETVKNIHTFFALQREESNVRTIQLTSDLKINQPILFLMWPKQQTTATVLQGPQREDSLHYDQDQGRTDEIGALLLKCKQ